MKFFTLKDWILCKIQKLFTKKRKGMEMFQLHVFTINKKINKLMNLMMGVEIVRIDQF